MAQSVPTQNMTRQQKAPASSKQTYEFDICVSFAGVQRPIAEELSEKMRALGYQVFYDNFYPEQLWGKDLPVFFDEIYRKKSRYCVIFVSNEYLAGAWTNHERQSAIARGLQERGEEYILPIQVHDIELPGLQTTIGYLTLHSHTIPQIVSILDMKLKA